MLYIVPRILLRDEIASRNCSFTYFTACHACLFVLFSCHTNGKSASPGKLNYFAFTQASRQTSWGGGESLFFVLREFSRSRALLPFNVTAFLMIAR